MQQLSSDSSVSQASQVQHDITLQIHGAEVDIWAHQETQQDVMESVRMYPPRFTVRVHGEDATTAAVAHMSFVGASKELSTEVVLPVRTKSMGSTAGVLPSRGS